MSSFTGSEDVWAARLGNLRDTVRQHVIAVQLSEHLHGVRTVLDVGCGQGTQALRLAELGLDVTGTDPSTELLDRFRAEAAARGARVRVLPGDVAILDASLGSDTFDLVCAHGLLMYLPDAATALSALTRRLTPAGRLSFTVRNADALAYRPGIRGDFAAALAAFETTAYRSELRIDAQAHTRAQVTQWCLQAGLRIDAWYGVRVLTDGQPATARPQDVDLANCLAAEVEAGRRDPYRSFGSMLHFIASHA